MPEASLVITAHDKYSDAIKKMSDATKTFGKTQNELEQSLTEMTRNQAELQNALRKSGKELRDLEKQIGDTDDETSQALLTAKRADFNSINRNLALVKKGSRDLEKQLQKTGSAFSSMSNRATRASGGMSDVLKAFAASGLSQMVGQVAQEGFGMWINSRLGSESGNIVTSALSSAVSGAAIGTAVLGPGLGTAIGTAVGSLVGGITGAAKNKQARDDAFKSYVQEQTEGAISQRQSDIQTGSSIAAGRETDLISFSTLFKSRRTAERYLGDLVSMANTTPFLYDDLTAMSKTLATYGYGADSILPVLTKVGDAGAALGMNTSDMTMVATALGRMKSSDKATLEYLNVLNDRGIGAVQMLAEAKGMSVGDTYAAISKGEIKGGEASQLILEKLEELYQGSMQEQSQTFAGLTSTREGWNQQMQNAYGEGYNEERLKGIQAEIDWLSGASGKAQEEANKAIGAWQASLENAKEGYIRDAVNATMESDEYKQAKAEGDAAAMGRLIAAAKAQGNSDYLTNEGRDQELADQIALADAIRTDPSTMAAYEAAGYTMGQVFSKGMASAVLETAPKVVLPQVSDDGKPLDYEHMSAAELASYATPHAAGLKRVPYDGYAALLHEGERVLTAREARQADAGGSAGGGNVVVNVSGNQFAVRTDADIPAIAQALAEEIEIRLQAGTY